MRTTIQEFSKVIELCKNDLNHDSGSILIYDFPFTIFKKPCQKDIGLLNLAILISGRGSNMEAILKSIDEGQIRNVRPKVVVSNRSDSPGLNLAAQKFGVSTYVLSKGKDKTLSFEDELVQVLDDFGVHPKTGIICLAGFMRILSPHLVQRYTMRILNIHPSLLPAFPGLHAQRQALEYGAKVSGCTIHFVDNGIDTGPIIMQRAISIFDSDTEESLSQRILEIEHKLYPEALRLFSEGNLKVDGRRISLTDSKNRNDVI